MRRGSKLISAVMAIVVSIGATPATAAPHVQKIAATLDPICLSGKNSPFVAIKVSDWCEAFPEYRITVAEADLGDDGLPIQLNSTGPARFKRGGNVSSVNAGAFTFDFGGDKVYVLAVTNGPYGYEELSELAVKLTPDGRAMLVFANGKWGTTPHPELYFKEGPEDHSKAPDYETAPVGPEGNDARQLDKPHANESEEDLVPAPGGSNIANAEQKPVVGSSGWPLLNSFFSGLFAPILALFKAVFGRA